MPTPNSNENRALDGERGILKNRHSFSDGAASFNPRKKLGCSPRIIDKKKNKPQFKG
jgi:hypothetical protein